MNKLFSLSLISLALIAPSSVLAVEPNINEEDIPMFCDHAADMNRNGYSMMPAVNAAILQTGDQARANIKLINTYCKFW